MSPKEYEEQLQSKEKEIAIELRVNDSVWRCEFCSYLNVIQIEKEEIPLKDDMAYLLESHLENHTTLDDQSMVFCIDISGSMNTTTELQGKVNLKYGVSK